MPNRVTHPKYLSNAVGGDWTESKRDKERDQTRTALWKVTGERRG